MNLLNVSCLLVVLLWCSLGIKLVHAKSKECQYKNETEFVSFRCKSTESCCNRLCCNASNDGGLHWYHYVIIGVIIFGAFFLAALFVCYRLHKKSKVAISQLKRLTANTVAINKFSLSQTVHSIDETQMKRISPQTSMTTNNNEVYSNHGFHQDIVVH